MTETAGRFENLPVWARNEINKLKGDLDVARIRLAHALGKTPSRVRVDPYNDAEQIYLHDRTRVRFQTDSGAVDVNFDKDRDGIRVSCPNGLVRVYPNASNVVVIVPEAL